MAEEEIELSCFNSSASKISSREILVPVYESHSHADQTLAAPNSNSTNFISTTSAITSGIVASQQVHVDTHSHYRGSNPVRYVSALHYDAVPADGGSEVMTHAVLSPQHGTLPADRVSKVTHTGLSPQHGTLLAGRGSKVTHTGLSPQPGAINESDTSQSLVQDVPMDTNTLLSDGSCGNSYESHGTYKGNLGLYPNTDAIDVQTYKGKEKRNPLRKHALVNIPSDSSMQLHGDSSRQLHCDSSRQLHCDSSRQLHGDSSKQLHGDSSRQLHDNSSKQLHDNSSKNLHDNSSRQLHGDSSKQLHDNSSRQLHGDSSKQLHDNSSKQLHDNSSRQLHDNSSKKLHVNSSKKLHNSSKKLHDNSSKKLHDNSSKKLHDNSTKKLHDNSSKQLHDNSSRQLHDNSSRKLLTNSTGNICESLQLMVNSERDTSQLDPATAAVSGSEIMDNKGRDEQNNVNYSNRKKGSKRLKPKVDSFMSSISASENNRSRNRRSTADGQSVTASSTGRSGAYSSRRSQAGSNMAAHNSDATTGDTVGAESQGDEKETRSTNVESSDDTEDASKSTNESPDETESETSSPNSESQDDTESKTISTSEESQDDTESKTMSTSEESPDDSESKVSSGSEESPDDSESKVSSGSENSPDDTEDSKGVEDSTLSEDEENEDSPDGAEKEEGSDSPTSSPDDEDRKQRKKIKKRKGFFTKLMKSAPDEQWLLKMVLWFPVGIGMSVALFFLVIQKMSLQEKYKLIIGCGLGLVLSLTFAFSVQMRCIMTLVVPTFVGKAGRSYFAAFAIVYLVNGPITNIMDNCEEIVRSMTCNSELTANHSKTKFNLRMHPVQHAVGDLLKDNFLVIRASKAIKKAFSPLTKELKENEDENREMESSIKDVEKMGNKKDSVVDKIDNNYKDSGADKDAGKKVEKQWEKKMDLRCQGTFSHGVQRCRDKMRQLEEKCMDKLSFLGYLVCWPLKITVFCNLVKLIPGVVGMDCNAASQVSPGFGDTYVSARDVMDNMESGAKVNLQYKVVGSADANYMPVEEMRQATIHEVKAKTDTINITLKVITHLLTFTFLIVFYGAYKYNNKYLTDLNWDNKYITAYFRHIDARRKDRGKRTLLPLKKAEKKELYDPNKIKLSAAERKKVVAGTIQLLLRVIISAIICYMDSLFYQVLDIIARNSKIEYHQTGEHIVDIRIYGKGFMSALVRSFLERFNSKQELDSLTTNYACLPRPSKTDVVILSFIFGTYMLVWVFLYFEAFGLRMRRVIAAFYYRKREKKRILYLYNERYRKRVGFLMHMRKKVRKQLRDREYQRKIGIILALKRQYPFLSKCLGVFKASKDTCIICGELETKGFHTCPTEGCGVGYCRECWIDIKKKCYACGQVSDNEEDSGSDSETADDGHSSSEDSD